MLKLKEFYKLRINCYFLKSCNLYAGQLPLMIEPQNGVMGI
jgi:hypothetical protein